MLLCPHASSDRRLAGRVHVGVVPARTPADAHDAHDERERSRRGQTSSAAGKELPGDVRGRHRSLHELRRLQVPRRSLRVQRAADLLGRPAPAAAAVDLRVAVHAEGARRRLPRRRAAGRDLLQQRREGVQLRGVLWADHHVRRGQVEDERLLAMPAVILLVIWP
jgi:hypothetical protein